MGQSDDDVDWVRPESMSVGWLEPETPAGMFIVTDSDPAPVWIIPQRVAIWLRKDDAYMSSWIVDEDAHAYSGAYIGPVELELDTKSFEPQTQALTAGDLLIRGGTILLSGRGSYPGQRNPMISVATVKASANCPHSLVCRRWALVRAASEDRMELFRREPDQEEA